MTAQPVSERWREDVALATACIAGDRDAWGRFERRYFGYIRAFARQFGLSDETAEDVADRVIADLWARGTIARYGGRSSLKTWLGALVTNAALNARVTERRRAPLTERIGLGQADRREASEAGGREAEALLSVAVAAALRSLEPADRLLVLLHYEQRLSLGEIVRLEGTSKATLSRSLKRIRQRLQEGIEDRLAKEHGTTWTDLRSGVDLGRIDLNLPALLGR